MRAATLESRLEELGVLKSSKEQPALGIAPHLEVPAGLPGGHPRAWRRLVAGSQYLWADATFSTATAASNSRRHLSATAEKILRFAATMPASTSWPVNVIHPWSRTTRCWHQPEVVWINPPPPKTTPNQLRWLRTHDRRQGRHLSWQLP